MKLYKPYPLKDNPTFTPEKDVSLIVCTLDPPESFEECLVQWCANRPLEIIIITTVEFVKQVQLIVDGIITRNSLNPAVIEIITSEKGKRKQMTAGLAIAKGSLIASTDDHILWNTRCITSLLACFEDDKVGAACPQVDPRIPKSRQNAETITPWEVAATKLTLRGGGGGWYTGMWAASRWCFVIGGPAGVYRASILQDPEFTEAFNDDRWRGTKLDVGEDTFISRWVPRKGYAIATQWTPEAHTTRTVKRGPSFIHQIVRWERSSIQTFMKQTIEIPGFFSWR